MAPKRPNPMEEPPAASSSEEEETSSEEVSSSGEEEEEGIETEKPSSPIAQTPPVNRKPAPKKPDLIASASPRPQPSSSGSGSESESESEPETDHLASTVPGSSTVKPIASKHMGENSKTKQPRSKASASASAAKSTAKRPSETDGERTDPKRAKKKGKEASIEDGAVQESGKRPGEDSRKQLFQRLWSEDDEIAILKGMIEYSAKKGVDPSADMNAFHDFIRKSLHVEVTKTQLVDKIRRLKKKYANNLGKGKKGEDRTFSKAHEQKAYDLSKKVWGVEKNNGAELVKSNGKPRNQRGNDKSLAALKAKLLSSPDLKKVEILEIEQNHSPSQAVNEIASFGKNLGVTGLEEYVIKHGLDLIGGPKKAELENKWKELEIAQLELFVERTELILEQAKLMLAASKS